MRVVSTGIGWKPIAVIGIFASCCFSGCSADHALPAALREVPVQSGYGTSESFCAESPMAGQVQYVVTNGKATFKIQVKDLPPKQLLGIDWINDAVRGYTVAAFETDSHGQADNRSLRMFRPGEVKGIGLNLTTTDQEGRVLEVLHAC